MQTRTIAQTAAAALVALSLNASTAFADRPETAGHGPTGEHENCGLHLGQVFHERTANHFAGMSLGEALQAQGVDGPADLAEMLGLERPETCSDEDAAQEPTGAKHQHEQDAENEERDHGHHGHGQRGHQGERR